MINHYLYNRKSLTTTFLIVDLRHKPSVDDCTMYDFIKSRQDGCVVIATKADKVKKSEIEKNLCIVSDTLKMDDKDILIAFSAEKGTGVSEALEVLYGISEGSV